MVKMEREGTHLSSIMDEVQELHDMNVQLLETLIVIGTRFFEYTKKYEIKIEGMENLSALISKATRLVDEIGIPYRGSPIMPLDSKPPRDKLTPYPIGGVAGRNHYHTYCQIPNRFSGGI
jgi:hypothetical protein